jgi:hypothetical protein
VDLVPRHLRGMTAAAAREQRGGHLLVGKDPGQSRSTVEAQIKRELPKAASASKLGRAYPVRAFDFVWSTLLIADDDTRQPRPMFRVETRMSSVAATVMYQGENSFDKAGRFTVSLASRAQAQVITRIANEVGRRGMAGLTEGMNTNRPQPTARIYERDDLHQPGNRHVEVPRYEIPMQTTGGSMVEHLFKGASCPGSRL